MTIRPASLAIRATKVSALLACAFLLRAGAARADNPIVQTNYTADPAPMVHEGRLYLYTSHDEDVTVNDFYTMNDWRVYSTVDMVNWTDHGSPASYKTFSWGTGDAWAPHGATRNGKFYLYVPLNNNTGAKIGVGIADSPIGPFTDALGKALISTGTGDIDPTVFIDDDDQAYLYWGNPNLWWVKLNADMLTYQGSPTKTDLQGFTSSYVEGPWFYKRGSLYYMVYPSGGVPEKISYTTSSSPTGPWTFGGDIMPSQMGAGSSFTNHPGVIDYKGKSYFFYHNGSAAGGGSYKRSVCVEEFTYGSDGKIPAIAMSKDGPAPVETLNPFQQVEGETIAFSAGLKTEKCTDTGGGINVTSISNGDYIKVKNVDFLDGVTSFEARVSATASEAKIELHLDSQTGTSLGTCDVAGASDWTTKTCAVSGGSGTHDLFLKFTGGSGDLLKLNWWKFDGPNTGTGGTGGMGGMAGLGGAGASGNASGGAASGGGGSGGGSGDSGAGGSGGTAFSGMAGQLGAGTGSSLGGRGGMNTTAGVGGSTGGSGAAPQGGGGSSAGTSPAAGGRAVGSAGGPAGDSPTPEPSGCGCRASSGSRHAPPLSALLILALGWRRRRRVSGV